MSTSYSKWRPHPWHGLSVGPNPPKIVHAYIEITPFDLIKYEIDKNSGYLRVDRPQRSSSQPPALYGFIPQTYCGDKVAALTAKASEGDGDPLDICILSERPITRVEIIIDAKVIGGLKTLDHNQVDDKIIAVLNKQDVWSDCEDLSDIPKPIIERLEHYFGTYKEMINTPKQVDVLEAYGAIHAEEVIIAAMKDYSDQFEN
jgi:inorganic pyrophosphatase